MLNEDCRWPRKLLFETELYESWYIYLNQHMPSPCDKQTSKSWIVWNRLWGRSHHTVFKVVYSRRLLTVLNLSCQGVSLEPKHQEYKRDESSICRMTSNVYLTYGYPRMVTPHFRDYMMLGQSDS